MKPATLPIPPKFHNATTTRCSNKADVNVTKQNANVANPMPVYHSKINGPGSITSRSVSKNMFGRLIYSKFWKKWIFIAKVAIPQPVARNQLSRRPIDVTAAPGKSSAIEKKPVAIAPARHSANIPVWERLSKPKHVTRKLFLFYLFVS